MNELLALLATLATAVKALTGEDVQTKAAQDALAAATTGAKVLGAQADKDAAELAKVTKSVEKATKARDKAVEDLKAAQGGETEQVVALTKQLTEQTAATTTANEKIRSMNVDRAVRRALATVDAETSKPRIPTARHDAAVKLMELGDITLDATGKAVGLEAKLATLETTYPWLSQGEADPKGKGNGGPGPGSDPDAKPGGAKDQAAKDLAAAQKLTKHHYPDAFKNQA